MYLNSDYSNYEFLVEANNNFVILSTSSRIHGSSGDPDTIPIIYNYFDTGFVLPSSYSSEEIKSFTNVSSYFSNDILELTYAPFYSIVCFFVIIFILFLINNLTKLFKKGGIFRI